MQIIKFIKRWFTIRENYFCSKCKFVSRSAKGLKIHVRKKHN